MPCQRRGKAREGGRGEWLVNPRRGGAEPTTKGGNQQMTERRMCDVCGVRPAVVTVRRVVPGEPPRTEHLCEVHAAQTRGGRSPLGGGGLFDDFFGRFFDAPEGPLGSPGRRTTPTGRRAEQVDITQFFSDSTGELLQRAAQQAA